jgi:hypothetical protein
VRARILCSISAVSLVGLFLSAPAPVSGQSSASSRAAAPSAAAPRTPWGDPDLQGTYTNTYENGTPFERSDQFVEGNYGLKNILSAARAEERGR